MPSLTDPLDTGTLHLKNRIVMPPMAFGLSNERGEVTKGLSKHYLERCRDLGLLIVEATNVCPSGHMFKKQLSIADDSNLAGFEKLVKELHKHETTVAIQLVHAGGTAPRELIGGQPLAPSSVKIPELYEEAPKEMGQEDIDGVVRAFIESAGRARAVGFDAVELHGAHGYLLDEFFSPHTNHREDDYGGSLENRTRISLRIVEGIKREVGPDFPVLYRLGAEDILPGGLSLSEGTEVAQILAQHGVDILDVSGGVGLTLEWLDEQSSLTGVLVPQATAVRAAVDVPVIGVGGVKTAEEADAIIRSGSVDLIAVGRAILRDPEWASKAVKNSSPHDIK